MVKVSGPIALSLENKKLADFPRRSMYPIIRYLGFG